MKLNAKREEHAQRFVAFRSPTLSRIIHKLISKEEQYAEDLDIVHSVFITPLRTAKPPVIEPYRLDEFIEQVFSNILDLRENNRRLLEVMYVRQREQAPVIQRIGDIFLDAATEFRLAYPIYVGHHPLAERRMKEELEANPKFRLFVEASQISIIIMSREHLINFFYRNVRGNILHVMGQLYALTLNTS